MEILILSNGESQSRTEAVSSDDPPLTHAGMRQAALTASWLAYNFRTKGFRCLAAPHLATLQTASAVCTVTEMPGVVSGELRGLRTGMDPLLVENRSVPFGNLMWPPKVWTEESKIYPPETVDQFIERCRKLLENLEKFEYGRVLLVSQAAVTLVLAGLATGKTPAEVKSILREAANKPARTGSLENFFELMRKNVLKAGVKPCGFTYVVNGHASWASRIAYE